MLPFSIIICTRNRPALLGRIIESIIQNTNAMPYLIQIIVVDSSRSPESEEVVSLFRRKIPVQFLKTGTSTTLPEKRNIAIENLSGDPQVIFFLDDDVELDPTFIQNTLKCFGNPKIIGVGGRDVNKKLKNPKSWQIFFNLTSAQQGVILSSGQNIEYVTSDDNMEVEWISGCVMSFRTSLFNQIRFDENRHFDGEDVDFTFRASKFGTLVCSPSAKYLHSSSLSSLPNKNHRVRDLIAHRSMLVLGTNGKVRFWPTYLSFLVLGLAMSIKGLSKREASLINLGIRHLALGFLSPIYILYLLTKKRTFQ